MRAQIIIIENGVMVDKPLKNRPIIVIITGDGVIEKAAYLCERVIQSNDFYWSQSGEDIAFTRRQDLNIENLMFIKVSKKVNDEVINDCLSIFKREYYTIKNEKLLMLIRKRLTYPFLGVIFILLLFNFLINSNISSKNSAIQQELTVKRKNTDKQRQQTTKQQKLEARIRPNRSQKISVIVDKIASVVPDHTTLTLLSIDPLIRSPENKKELQINRNLLLIKGISKNVSSLQHSLSTFLNDVKIKKIEQETFEIEARL